MPVRAGVQLYDAKTGRPIQFATPDEAHAALDAGAAGVSRKAPVPMIDPDGKAVTVAPQDLAQARAAGARLSTGEEQRKAELEAKYGRGGTLADAAYGFVAREAGIARGLTAGLSDVAGVELSKALLGAEKGGQVRQFLSDMKEHHGATSTFGEVGGYLGGALIGNEASAAQGAGKLAKFLPSALIDSAGASVEGSIARALGPAESVLGRAGQSAIKLGARAATENAIVNVADAVSEAELGDHELNAEKLYVAARTGALTGAIGGGVLGGAGSLAASGAKGLAKIAAPKLTEMAGEQWWKAINPAKKFTAEANERAGGTAAVGRTIADEVIGDMSVIDIARKASTPEDMLPLIEGAHARIGDDLGKAIGARNARVKVSAISDIFEGKIAPLRKLADHEPIVARLEASRLSWMEKLGAVEALPNGTIRFREGVTAHVQDVLEQRKALDKIIYEENRALAAKGHVAHMREIRSGIEDAILSSIDDAARAEGNTVARTEIETLKRKYQHLSIAKEAAENAADARMSNRTFSLTDSMGMLGVAGSAIASGNPAAALLAPLAGYGHKLVRERGNAVVAAISDRVAAFAAVRKAQAEVDSKIGSAVDAYLAPRGPRPRLTKLAPAGESPSTEYDRRVKALDDVRADPAAAVARAHERVAPVAAYVPMTAEAHAAVAGRAIPYLLSKEPKGRVPAVSAMPQFDRPQISDTQKDAFVEIARTVEDPTYALDALEKGTISRDHVEALQVVYPKLYAEVVQNVRVKLAQQEKEPPYQKVQALSLLLGAPLTETQTPEFISAMQQAAANGNAGAQKQQGPSPQLGAKRPIKLDTSVYATSPENTK